jgi:hypothetical protein
MRKALNLGKEYVEWKRTSKKECLFYLLDVHWHFVAHGGRETPPFGYEISGSLIWKKNQVSYYYHPLFSNTSSHSKSHCCIPEPSPDRGECGL